MLKMNKSLKVYKVAYIAFFQSSYTIRNVVTLLLVDAERQAKLQALGRIPARICCSL